MKSASSAQFSLINLNLNMFEQSDMQSSQQSKLSPRNTQKAPKFEHQRLPIPNFNRVLEQKQLEAKMHEKTNSIPLTTRPGNQNFDFDLIENKEDILCQKQKTDRDQIYNVSRPSDEQKSDASRELKRWK